MFTYIVPTIFKSEKWKTQLKSVIQHPYIQRVYLIVDLPRENHDVDLSIFDENFKFKIEVHYTGGGMFCNGAWNFAMDLGIPSENIILANDDILYNTSVIDIFGELNLKEYGIIGCGTDFRQHTLRPFGFGQLMFMNKEHYTRIPNGIKHWFGDDWLFYSMCLLNKPNYTTRILYETNFSESSDSDIVRNRIREDMEWWTQNSEQFKNFYNQ
jgi:hypothetical protein